MAASHKRTFSLPGEMWPATNNSDAAIVISLICLPPFLCQAFNRFFQARNMHQKDACARHITYGDVFQV